MRVATERTRQYAGLRPAGWRLAGFVAFCCLGNALPSSGARNFSGTYVSIPSFTDGRLEPVRTIKISQTGDVLEIATIEGGESRLNRYRLQTAKSGRPAVDGGRGTVSAKIKGRDLLIDSRVTAPPAVLRVRQRWRLSRDGARLRVETTVDGETGALARPSSSLSAEVFARE